MVDHLGDAFPQTVRLLQRQTVEGLGGAQVFVATSKGALIDAAFGHSEPGREATCRDVARMYCTVKPLLAICAARAVEEGLLTYDDAVAHFLPLALDRGPLRVGDLLAHRSFLPLSFADPYLVDFGATVQQACRKPLRAGTRPTRPTYNTTLNWHLLAAVLECAFRADLAAIVRKEVLDPLGPLDLWLTHPPPDRYVQLHRTTAAGTEPAPEPGRERLFSRVNPAHGGFSTVRALGQVYVELLRCLRGEGVLLTAGSVGRLLAHYQDIDMFNFGRRRWGLGFDLDLGPALLGPRWGAGSFGHLGTAPRQTVICSVASPAHDLVVVFRLFTVDARNDWRVHRLGAAVAADLAETAVQG